MLYFRNQVLPIVILLFVSKQCHHKRVSVLKIIYIFTYILGINCQILKGLHNLLIECLHCLLSLIICLIKDSSSYSILFGLLSSGLNHYGMWFCYWQWVSGPDWTHKRWAQWVWLSPQQCCASPYDISSHLFHHHPVGVTSSLWPSSFRDQTNVIGLASKMQWQHVWSLH